MSLRTALPLLVVIISAGAGRGQIVTIDTDTVYDTPFTGIASPQFIVVDGDEPPTILDVVDPAYLDTDVFRAPAIELRGMSVLNVSGGRVGTCDGAATILATSRSIVNVSGGSIDSCDAHGIRAVDQARVIVSGGLVSGGDDGDDNALRLEGEATAEITGGTVSGDLGNPAIKGLGNGQLTIRGGWIVSDIVAEDSSVVDIQGGTLDLGASDLAFLRASDESIVNVYGGDFNPSRNTNLGEFNKYRIEGNDQSTVNIHGTDLSAELWFEDRYRLRGRLADGNELDVIIRGNVVLHEVPEPSTLLLALIRVLLLPVLARGKSCG